MLLIPFLLAGCGLGNPRLLTSTPGGGLAPCDFARCVSSTDPEHFVAPIRYSGSRDAARSALLRVIAAMEGARLVTQTPDYVHAEFTVGLLRHVDDVELLFSARDKLVHIRSASRLGMYDFDVNRERVEAIRAGYEALQP